MTDELELAGITWTGGAIDEHEVLDAASDELRGLLENQRAERLESGRTLYAYPPFCSEESANGVALRAVSAAEGLSMHADFARVVAAIPDGGRIRLTTPARDEES